MSAIGLLESSSVQLSVTRTAAEKKVCKKAAGSRRLGSKGLYAKLAFIFMSRARKWRLMT